MTDPGEDLKVLARRLRNIAKGTRLSSLAVPDLEDAADALDRLASVTPAGESEHPNDGGARACPGGLD